MLGVRLDHPLPRPRDPDRGRLVLVPRPLPRHLLARRLLRRRARRASGSIDPLRCSPCSAPLGFFGSILLHELGHAIVALRNGIGISSIQLWIFGGDGADGPRSRHARRPSSRSRSPGRLVTLAIVVVLTVGRRRRRRLRRLPRAAVARDQRRRLRRCWRWSPGWSRSTSWSSSSTCCRPSRWTAAGSPARSPGGGPATATRRPASPPTSAASSATSSSPAACVLIFTGDVFGGIWLALIGMVINGSARGAAMQTAITEPDRATSASPT